MENDEAATKAEEAATKAEAKFPPVWGIDEDSDLPKASSMNALTELFDHEQTIRDWQWWRKAAILVSLTSVLLTSILAIAAFVCSKVTTSSAEFAIAFDAALGVVSSAVILWRFRNGNDELLAPEKERKACLVIAGGFVLSAIMMFSRAIYCLAHDLGPTKTKALFVISALGCLVYTVLFCAKRKVAQQLHSVAMGTDAMDSICGAVVAFGVVLSTLIYQRARDSWWLDPAFALVVAIVTFAYGLVVIFHVVRSRDTEEYVQF